MKKESMKKLSLFVLLVIVIGGLLFMLGRWSAPKAASDHNQVAAENGDAEPAAEREQIYTCPMHPQVRTTDPNELCPICAMELVPLEDDDDDDDADLPRLRVSERAAALMNVQTVPARRAAAEREVRLFGRIEVDERRQRTITAWASGRLDELFVDFTGQQVEQGEPIVRLYSPQLIAAQEELLQAIEAAERLRGRNASDDDAGVAAVRDRLRLLGVSPIFIDELETTRQVQDHLTIDSPLAGTVTRRFVSQGDYVDVGDPLFAVADLSHLWVQLSVFESDLLWLHEGQAAQFTTQSLPGRTFEGTVSFIEPILDDRTRSVRVRINLPNEDGRLKPGMFVNGVVRAAVDGEGSSVADAEQVHHQPLIIPASAPLITGRSAVVYIQLRDTERPTFEARDVVLGPRAGDMYVLLEGLEERDLVVVNGQFRIDSELQIRGRPSMMQPAAEEEPPAPIVPHHHAAYDIAPDDISDAFVEQLLIVLDDYLALTDAMAQDDYDKAVSIAHQLHERLYDVDTSELDERARGAWEALDGDLHEHLHAMLDAGDFDSIRPPLEPLTEFVAIMVAHFMGDRAGTVYRAHCPMVDDNRGADWLQRETAIANPYFGSMMFRCGDIVGEVQMEKHEGMEAEEHEKELDVDEELHADIVFPDAFRNTARAALDQSDEIVGAIEHEHDDHARQAVRQMQDALFAMDFDALDDEMMQAWMRADVEIMDALRAMLEADLLDAMHDHVPHLKRSVERARAMIDAEEGGDT